MVKLIGVLLLATSLVSFAVGAFIDAKYGTHAYVTGNVIVNIMTQPAVPVGIYDYLEAVAFSYSFISFIMGILFLARM